MFFSSKSNYFSQNPKLQLESNFIVIKLNCVFHHISYQGYFFYSTVYSSNTLKSIGAKRNMFWHGLVSVLAGVHDFSYFQTFSSRNWGHVLPENRLNFDSNFSVRNYGIKWNYTNETNEITPMRQYLAGKYVHYFRRILSYVMRCAIW